MKGLKFFVANLLGSLVESPIFCLNGTHGSEAARLSGQALLQGKGSSAARDELFIPAPPPPPAALATAKKVQVKSSPRVGSKVRVPSYVSNLQSNLAKRE